jgi:hypothetical protein
MKIVCASVNVVRDYIECVCVVNRDVFLSSFKQTLFVLKKIVESIVIRSSFIQQREKCYIIVFCSCSEKETLIMSISSFV